MTTVRNRFFKSQKWVMTFGGIIGVMCCMAASVRWPAYREAFAYGAAAIAAQAGIFVASEATIDAVAAKSPGADASTVIDNTNVEGQR